MRLSDASGNEGNTPLSLSNIVARVAAVVGGAARVSRQWTQGSPEPAWGTAPAIPEAKPQGSIPTLKMPTAQGWAQGQTPIAAPGLAVNAFATGLDHPRWIYVLPNGDVLIAESSNVARANMRNLFDYAMVSTMKRARAVGVSANRITLLRDADGDGIAEIQEVFLEGLNQPFGMALLGDTFYVGNTDGIVAFPYTEGTTKITAPGRKIATFKPGGHWTRSLLPSPDGRKLYAGVGSSSNIADDGMAAEEGRALIHELDVATGVGRTFAGGLRNAVGMAWEPTTGVLWTVVNERDGLGDETPPDYLTSVREGGFYGWPYCYWGQTVDDRVPQDPALVATAITPDYALGGHTASLGLCWVPAGTLPGFPDGMAIGQHGSWNRSKLSGYKLVFIPFENGRPSGPPRDILSGSQP
jgi:glucose/arabinose dehydrogenase